MRRLTGLGMVELLPLRGGDELPATRDREENADVIPQSMQPWAQLDDQALGVTAPGRQATSTSFLGSSAEGRAPDTSRR
jgi:hypothetical protein